MIVFQPNSIVRNNNVSNIGLIPNTLLGTAGQGTGIELSITGDASILVENNVVYNVGYIGVFIRGIGSIVQKNFISYFGMTLRDCGGIYASGASSINQKILNNVLLYGIGNAAGTPSNSSATQGIYLDSVTANKLVEGNTVAYCGLCGIRLHNSYNINVINNTCFANGNGLFTLKSEASAGYIRDNSINNNIFFSMPGNTYPMFFLTYINEDPLLFGQSDNNYLMSPFTNDTSLVRTQIQTPSTIKNYDLPTWQTTGNDINSHIMPFMISSSDMVYFDYNVTSQNKTVGVNYKYKNIDGTPTNYSSYTLAPYESIILLYDASATAQYACCVRC